MLLQDRSGEPLALEIGGVQNAKRRMSTVFDHFEIGQRTSVPEIGEKSLF
jgi:hypothetical protein